MLTLPIILFVIIMIRINYGLQFYNIFDHLVLLDEMWVLVTIPGNRFKIRVNSNNYSTYASFCLMIVRKWKLNINILVVFKITICFTHLKCVETV